jgi:hypothetical protein
MTSPALGRREGFSSVDAEEATTEPGILNIVQ